MIVDGKAIAQDVLAGVCRRVADLGRTPSLAVLVCGPTFATENFLNIKKQKAQDAGIRVDVVELAADSRVDDVLAAMDTCSQTADLSAQADGIVVQLPFPQHIDIEAILARLPADRDVDVIGSAADAAFAAGDALVLPPVVGAIDEIVRRHDVEIAGKRVAVLGRGRLVGKPTAVWAAQKGGDVTALDEASPDIREVVQEADIVISGAGSPGLITSDMVKDGVVIFDAGTSEEGGKLVGDADQSVADKASLTTPVPGGIGPITVAKLLENLVMLAQKRETGA